jgi:hypothetical protein
MRGTISPAAISLGTGLSLPSVATALKALESEGEASGAQAVENACIAGVIHGTLGAEVAGHWGLESAKLTGHQGHNPI